MSTSPSQVSHSRLRKVSRIALIFVGLLTAWSPAKEYLVDKPAPLPAMEYLVTTNPVTPKNPVSSEISAEPTSTIL